MKRIYIFQTVLLIVMIFGCKPAKKTVYDPSSVTITVVDENNNVIPGAYVRMYDDRNKYTNALIKGEESGYISNELTNEFGVVRFDELNTDKVYFFLVTYRDRANLSDLDNSVESFELNEYLAKGTDSYVKIIMKPSRSVIGFYAKSPLEKHLPIQLYINSYISGKYDSIGSLTTTGPVPTSPSDPKMLAIRLGQGLKTWYAKSALGCIWSGQIQVRSSSSFEPVELTDCNAGAVSFYIDSTKSALLPVKILIDDNIDIGILTKAVSYIPTSCSDKNSITLTREINDFNGKPKKYKYSAFGSTGCMFSGEFYLTADCQLIKLENCKSPF